MKEDIEESVVSVPKTRSRRRYIVIIGILIVVGLTFYGIVQLFDYYYNPGGTLVLEPREYQHWFLPYSHPLDLQKPRWKGVADQDTFSVYFGPSAAIDILIANFTDGLSLDAFTEYLLANATHYFNNWLTIPSAGNWSIIAINPHTYTISVENSLMSLTYTTAVLITTNIGIAAGIIIVLQGIVYVVRQRQRRRLDKDYSGMQEDNEKSAAGF